MSETGQLDATVNAHAAAADAVQLDLSGNVGPVRLAGATSPWVVVLVFVLNALPGLALELFLHLGLAVGILAGFTLYFIAYEEIHWRFHLGGWLPGWLRATRNHHMLHHGGFEGRYNVFLPIFDWIFQRRAWKHGSVHGSR